MGAGHEVVQAGSVGVRRPRFAVRGVPESLRTGGATKGSFAEEPDARAVRDGHVCPISHGIGIAFSAYGKLHVRPREHCANQSHEFSRDGLDDRASGAPLSSSDLAQFVQLGARVPVDNDISLQPAPDAPEIGAV